MFDHKNASILMLLYQSLSFEVNRSFKNSRNCIVIQISIKSNQLLLVTIPSSQKFHQNASPFLSCPGDRQTMDTGAKAMIGLWRKNFRKQSTQKSNVIILTHYTEIVACLENEGPCRRNNTRTEKREDD